MRRGTKSGEIGRKEAMLILVTSTRREETCASERDDASVSAHWSGLERRGRMRQDKTRQTHLLRMDMTVYDCDTAGVWCKQCK